MTEDKKAGKTPTVLLEEEVIRATKRLPVTYIDADDGKHVVHILPLPESALTEGAEQLAAVLTPLANEFMKLSVRADNARRSAAGSGQVEGIPGSAPAADGGISKEIFDDFFSPAGLQEVLQKFPGLIRYLVTIGTDVEYDEIKHDVFVAVQFAIRVLTHNIGPRLRDFISSDLPEITKALEAAGSAQKRSSSKPATRRKK